MIPSSLGAPTTSTLDEDVRDVWAGGSPKPLVFIMGLHRSGTTVLYQFLARVLPVCPVTVQDVVFYPRRAQSHVQDGGEADRARLAAYFEENGLARRVLDAIPLSPETVEEYGWILKREAGSFALGEETLPTFRDLVLKLSWLRPDASALLLKNPWDTPRADQVAALFPEARFVFLLRDPIEVLSSELRNATHFSSERNPLVQLLTEGIPRVRFYLGLARMGRRLMGERLSERFLVWWLLKDVMNNLRAYRAAMERIPPSRVVQLRYSELVDDTRGALERVAQLTGLPVSDAVDELRARRRSGGLLPAIEARRAELEETVEREGLSWALGA